MSFFKRMFGKEAAPQPAESVHDARVKAYEAGFGKLPQDIQKLGNLMGIWPGGGLYVIPAPQLRPGAAIYASFGLTNPDMPSTVTMRDVETETIEKDGGRTVTTRGTIVQKEQPPPARDWPGYGYEIVVAACDNEEWPLWLLQWAVQAEILGDIGMRDRVEKYGGMTIESVRISETAAAHLLITRAQAPLPAELALPTGSAAVMFITVITEAEMHWSKQHGPVALLARLQAAGVGQFSVLDRESVVSAPDLGACQVLSLQKGVARNFDHVTSREHALLLVAHGRLEKILSLPDRFGGEDFAPNQLFVPPGVAALKDQVTEELVQAVGMGLIDNLNVQPEYKGKSFVPARIHIAGTHSGNDSRFDRTIDIW